MPAPDIPGCPATPSSYADHPIICISSIGLGIKNPGKRGIQGKPESARWDDQKNTVQGMNHRLPSIPSTSKAE
jgi:hypothetical protein